MKRTAILFLAAAMVLSLVACGENNTATPDADVSQPSTQGQTVTISSDWLGTYHSTDGDKEIVLTVTSTGGTVEIDGAPSELTARAEYANEIQLIDGDGSVVHLTRFSDNPVDKRYDFAVTAKDDQATQIKLNKTYGRTGRRRSFHMFYMWFANAPC
jgi:ABC-type glycerol-3-phosphate transport system substrate-binding protein